MKYNINALRVIPDNRYSNIAFMQQPGNILSDQSSNTSEEVFQVEPVMQSYNTVVAPLASNHK